VLLLYIEDNLDGDADHDAAAAAIESAFGTMLYKPSGSGCTKLPIDSLSRADVLAKRAQVVIVSDCGAGAQWPRIAFDWSSHVEERPHDYKAAPDCGPDFSRKVYDTNLVRYYEDSTWLTAGASNFGQSSVDDGITPATATAMAECGVDLIGLDQLTPNDGRLHALVWSWATEQPSSGECAVQRDDRRWESRPCGEAHPAACRDARGIWTATAAAVTAADAPAACAARGATFAVPRTGWENYRAWRGRRHGDAWIALRRTAAGWGSVASAT